MAHAPTPTRNNDYFGQFCRFAACNLVACVGYFLLAAILSLAGAPADADGSLSTVVVILFYAAALFLACRYSRAERTAWRALGRPFSTAAELRGYFRGSDPTLPAFGPEIGCFAVWTLFGAMIAVTGEAISIALYLFLAQAMPCTLLMRLLGTVPGLAAGILFNLVLFTAIRVGALLLARRAR